MDPPVPKPSLTCISVTPEFLEKEVLQPFTKADPFMPGAGLGLGLAQRMIEILAGKFAIASTLNKGTLVHIEIPLHLLNEDNESDQDELEVTSDAGGSEGSGLPPRSPIRQDGIYLAGFDCKDLGMRRVGKSLTRTLMLHFCRVVTEIQYASLIVAPDRVDMVHLADVASRARPGVHIIILRKDGGGRSSLLDTSDDPTSPVQIAARELLQAIPMRYLNRPLGPSLIREIVKPVEAEPQLKETFISPVAGGSDAQQIAESPKSARPSFGRGSSIDTLRPSPREPSFDAELMPSPPTSPDQPPVSAPFPDMPDAFIERSHFIETTFTLRMVVSGRYLGARLSVDQAT